NLDALKALLQYRVIAHNNDYLSSNLIEAQAKYDGVATGAVDTPSQEEVAQAAIEANFSDISGNV
ncbi:M13 family peptidase, partial [Streptococcus suis]